MKYRVTHKTEYIYGELVPVCYNLLRLRPRDTDLQICLHHELAVHPSPSEERYRVDFFGNHVAWIAMQEPHKGLKINAASEVENFPSKWDENLAGPPWEYSRQYFASHTDSFSLDALQYTFDSPHVARGPELAQFAQPDFPRGAPLAQCILNLTRRIYHDFTFDTGATTIGTPILEVLRHRHGVCQDFAHLQIGCLRSLGIAARYVSGYVLTSPPAGQSRRLIGADASHAWISAFIPEIGWVDFDPTNGVMPSGKHITIGWARDFDDISPVKGIVTGSHRHFLRYSVDVEPILPAPPERPASESSPAIEQAKSN